MKLAIALISICAFSACSTTRPPGIEHAEIRLLHGDPRVGTYVSSDKSFETSSYWIEGPQGLILIDTQFLFSAANELVDWAEQATGKKVVAAVILHPNPDKFNGTSVLQKRGIRVLTSQKVLEMIPEIHKDRHHWFYDRFKPDYPDGAPEPESFGNVTRELDLAGLKIKAHIMGPGCSATHVVIEYNHHVFVGDLVSELNHAWLEIGRTDEWLKRIEEIRALKPMHVHPGRGPSGGQELLDRQESYLKQVIALVAAEKPWLNSSPRPNAEGLLEPRNETVFLKLREKMETLYPGFGNSYFLEIGLPAEWSRQAARQ